MNGNLWYSKEEGCDTLLWEVKSISTAGRDMEWDKLVGKVRHSVGWGVIR